MAQRRAVGVGDGVTKFVPGDEVFGIGQGAFAEYAGQMTITPATAAPGAEINLTFPTRFPRGVGFSLADPGDEEKVSYYLTAAARMEGAKPGWWSAAESEGRGWVDIGISGPGPDRLMVPTMAADGTCLLCTANASGKVCALLTVKR